jgi:hypothetical protein
MLMREKNVIDLIVSSEGRIKGLWHEFEFGKKCYCLDSASPGEAPEV